MTTKKAEQVEQAVAPTDIPIGMQIGAIVGGFYNVLTEVYHMPVEYAAERTREYQEHLLAKLEGKRIPDNVLAFGKPDTEVIVD